MQILHRSGISVEGRRVVIVGRSDIVGKPLAMLLGLLFTVMMSRVRTRELTSEFMGTLMLTIVGVLIVARANESPPVN